MPTRYFSLEDARALIPQIRPQLQLALQLHASLRGVVLRINDAGYDVDWSMLHGEVELDDEALPEDLDNVEKARGIYLALRESLEVIEAHGCEVKGVVDGLVDFRSWRDGSTEVSLCWKIGEPTIGWYHELHEGIAGRRSLEGHEFVAERLVEGREHAGVSALLREAPRK